MSGKKRKLNEDGEEASDPKRRSDNDGEYRDNDDDYRLVPEITEGERMRTIPNGQPGAGQLDMRPYLQMIIGRRPFITECEACASLWRPLATWTMTWAESQLYEAPRCAVCRQEMNEEQARILAAPPPPYVAPRRDEEDEGFVPGPFMTEEEEDEYMMYQ